MVDFDFGGGTFDAALVLVTDGQITVKDTEGDNHLGGKDLDFSVVDQIILQRVKEECDLEAFLSGDPTRRARLRNALKKWAEQVNITLSYHDSHFVETDLGRSFYPTVRKSTLTSRSHGTVASCRRAHIPTRDQQDKDTDGSPWTSRRGHR